jgi:putative ABC transport system permease protein
MEALVRDIRTGIRSLLKNRGFAVTACLTLAVGLGANTAIFSFVNALLLRPLPFRNADRLIVLSEVNPEKRKDLVVASPRNVEDWEKQSQTIEQFSTWRDWHFRVAAAGAPLKVGSGICSPSLFSVLGLQPQRGRFLLADDNQPGRDHVVVITNSFWQSQFNRSDTAIGQTLLLDKEPYQIVGVLPPEFEALNLGTFHIWAPLSVDPDQTLGRHARNRRVYARLKDGVSLEQAQTEMSTISSRLAEAYPKENSGWKVVINTLQREEVGDLRIPILIFLAAVGMVLLIACINVSNLLIAQSAARRKEFAVRLALGASRFQLVRQLVTESILLSMIGGTAGLLFANWLVNLFIAISPSTLEHPDKVTLDAKVLGFTFLLSIFAGILFGVLPGVQSSNVNLVSELKDAHSLFGSRRGRFMRELLVVSQVGMALTLLIGAGLLGQTFFRLLRHNPGFNPDNLITASVFVPLDKYKKKEQVSAVYDQIINDLKAIPGVESIGASSSGPQFGGFETMDVSPRNKPSTGEYPQAVYFNSSPNYFATLGIPLLKGRDFSSSDTFSSPQVAMVNETLAKRFWPSEEAVGKRLDLVRENGNVEIIGVVGDVNRYGLDEKLQPEIYFPYSQQPRWATFLVMRTNAAPAETVAAIRSHLRQIDPDLLLSRTSTMDQQINSYMKRPRFNLILLVMFAATALLLAAIGLFGVMAYLVEQQTREIGIRTALGAQRKHILRLMVFRPFFMALVGVGLGVGAALALNRFLAGMLYGVGGSDPITYVGVSLLLLGVVAIACYLPARRATKVDPLVALRYE